MTLQIGFLLFPQVQQLDLTGPYDVLASLPGVQVHLIWKDLMPVTASTGLLLKPTTTFEDCPALDVICVPGGGGVGRVDGGRADAGASSSARPPQAQLRDLRLHRFAGARRGRVCCKANARPRIGRITICCRRWGRLR
jgi:hypothetical protein